MIDILTGIGEAILTFLQYIGNLFESGLWFITNIGTFMGTIAELSAYCPTFLLVFLEVSLALMVLLAIFRLF